MPDHNKIVDEVTKKQLIMLQPKRVVDVGAGNGSYGKMIRDCLNECKTIGIEIWKPYVKGFNLPAIYDEIIAKDIREAINDEEVHGDLIIFGDILEHLPKEDVFKVLNKAIKKFKFILINSPIGFQSQSESLGNPYEKHLCGLCVEDFFNYKIVECEEFLPDHAMFNLLIKGEKNGN